MEDDVLGIVMSVSGSTPKMSSVYPSTYTCVYTWCFYSCTSFSFFFNIYILYTVYIYTYLFLFFWYLQHVQICMEGWLLNYTNTNIYMDLLDHLSSTKNNGSQVMRTAGPTRSQVKSCRWRSNTSKR